MTRLESLDLPIGALGEGEPRRSKLAIIDPTPRSMVYIVGYIALPTSLHSHVSRLIVGSAMFSQLLYFIKTKKHVS